jgi:hypothetical protein
MNIWTKHSIDFANQRNYLDELFKVYPTIPEGLRDIDQNKWKKVEQSFQSNDGQQLLKNLLAFDLFPIKDSYVAYLKRDKASIERNPKTVQRLSSALFGMGLDNIYEKCSQPKETNRQIGPMFRNWVRKGSLGFRLTNNVSEFISSKEDLILDLSDDGLMKFAKENLDYNSNKGLDLVAKINNKYVIVEAKFLTDFGGHQNAQFNDAIALVTNEKVKAITIALLDGVPYIEGNNKMSKFVRENKDYNIMSALVLKEFLYQL